MSYSVCECPTECGSVLQSVGVSYNVGVSYRVCECPTVCVSVLQSVGVSYRVWECPTECGSVLAESLRTRELCVCSNCQDTPT